MAAAARMQYPTATIGGVRDLCGKRLGACGIPLLLRYDRSRTGSAHRQERRRKGRIQATGARAGPGRRTRAEAVAGATGAADRARGTCEARPRDVGYSANGN